MAKLGDLIVRVGADVSTLNNDLKQAKSSMKKMTGELQNVGKQMSMAVTAPLVIMGATSVQAFREQNKAIAQVEAGLKSTAGQVGFTSKQLQKMATDLQNKTLFGDEVILKDATAQLLTFTNISGENFARTQQAALDLATRLDGDLKGASIQLGKALNDPVANLSALSRSGIQFSEEQKGLIKTLAETGRLSEAQALILDELNNQYGGSAEAAAEADGGFTQLANSFGDLQEEIGRLLIGYLQPIVKKMQSFIQFLQGTSDGTKTLALGIGAIAAAIGPILVLLPNFIGGIQMAQKAFVMLNATLLSNPFVAAAAALTAVAGAAYLLYENGTDAQEEVRKLRNQLNGLDKDEAVRIAAARIQVQKDEIEKQRKAVEAMRKTVMVGDAVERRVHNQTMARHAEELAAMEEVLVGYEKIHAEVLASETKIIAAEVSAEVQRNKTTKSIKTQKGKVDDLSESVGELGTTIEDINRPFTTFTDKLQDIELGELEEFDIAEEIFGDEEEFITRGDEIIKKLQEIGETAKSVIQTATNVGNTLGSTFADLTNKSIEIKQALAEGIITPLEAMEQKSEASKEAVRGLVKDGILALINFAKMNVIANATSPANAANLVSGGLATPAFIVAGLSMLEGFIGGLTAFADGGIVSGPTMGLIGEYPGARNNPEVIAPLDKLRGMLGGQSVQVTGRLSGRDILLSSEYSNIDRNRIRGY